MTQVARRLELMREAEGLAVGLRSGGAKRNDLRMVIDSLLLSEGAWEKRLESTQKFVENWVGSPFARRGHAGAVVAVVGPVLKRRLSEREMLFVLGWAARLLRAEQEQEA